MWQIRVDFSIFALYKNMNYRFNIPIGCLSSHRVSFSPTDLCLKTNPVMNLWPSQGFNWRSKRNQYASLEFDTGNRRSKASVPISYNEEFTAWRRLKFLKKSMKLANHCVLQKAAARLCSKQLGGRVCLRSFGITFGALHVA
jgi:hypothetical protein